MVGTATQHRILGGGIAVFVAAAALLLGTGENQISVVGWYPPHQVWLYWVPVALGLLLVRLVPPNPPEQQMSDRVHATMARRSVGRETVILAGCVLGFFVGEALLAPMFAAVDPTLAALSYHSAKVLFLLLVPLMFVGSSGVMRNAYGSDLPLMSTRVTEWWRWAGLGPVACYLLVVRSPLAAHPPELGSVPEHYDLLVTLVIGYAATALLEVVFFQGFLLTRLEILFGRWPAIVVTALVYALVSLVGSNTPDGPASTVVTAIVVQGVTALLYGYLWSRYRNIWLNFLLQAGIVSIIVLPVGVAPSW